MRRPGVTLTHEVLVEEARFILRTLQRDDLFGERVRLTEAERVIDSSISLSFADYCGFLNKYGYVRIDQLANVIEVTEGGRLVAQDLDDAEFHARLSRHFQRELGTSLRAVTPGGPSVPSGSLLPASASLDGAPQPLRSQRPSSPPSGALDEVLDRRYRRGPVIGSGTLGTVYRGQHVSLGRRMAIKEARAIFQLASYLRRDELVRRIRTTVERHSQLTHPGIVQIIDQNPEREYPYFVMELALGGSLRQRLLASNGSLPLPFAVRTLLQLAYALRYAHAQGVLHLGLKPENVLFDAHGNVKLVDFGFSRVTERSDESGPSPILIGSGSVGYMAPERLQPSAHEAAIHPGADVYALGMLFYEMITGKLPGRRSPLPSQAGTGVPAAFDDVFDRMTRDEVAERYKSIEDILDGIYRAFPATEVFAPGTVLLWASDPHPLPAENEAPAPALVDVASSPGATPRTSIDASEQKTGEFESSDPGTDGQGAMLRRRVLPPPPPPGSTSIKRRAKTVDE